MGAQWLEQSPYALEIRLCLTHSASPPIPFFVFSYFGGFSYGGSLIDFTGAPFRGRPRSSLTPT
eukprot:scaffold70407_cov46-Phaeocystis_antarctica.AAC.3